MSNFDIAHVLIAWGGKLPGGESWSCSLRCAGNTDIPVIGDVPSRGDVDAWCHGAIKDAVLAYHARATTRIHANAKLSYVKANRIGVDGLYMDQDTSEHVFADVGGGSTAFGAQTANQVALCVSLLTGFTRGLAHRGRFFLPLPAHDIDADGLILTSQVTDLENSTKTFLEAIADTPGWDHPWSLTPSVMSRKAGAPTRRRVTGVAVGRVLDTQRRRRRSLKEFYTQVNLDLGGA